MMTEADLTSKVVKWVQAAQPWEPLQRTAILRLNAKSAQVCQCAVTVLVAPYGVFDHTIRICQAAFCFSLCPLEVATER